MNIAVNRLFALAQPSRLAVFRLLVQHAPDGLPAGDVAGRLGFAPATLSHHLKELSAAGLLNSRQEGRFIHYSANLAAMNELLGYLTDNCCAGNTMGSTGRGECFPSLGCEDAAHEA